MNLSALPLPVQTLLALSNVFMSFAWYGQLRNMAGKAWFAAALVSWAIALFEYLPQVPANHIAYAGGYSLAEVKIAQEVMTLAVFVPFAVVYRQQLLKRGCLRAALCLVGAGCFIFRSSPHRPLESLGGGPTTGE